MEPDSELRIDKYTPEACSIIGNYYSLKGEHEKAVVYFQTLGVFYRQQTSLIRSAVHVQLRFFFSRSVWLELC